MTKPHQKPNEEALPTTIAGAAYLFVKRFGPWSLMAVFLSVVWFNAEKKSERWETLLETNIKANAAVAAAMSDLSNSIKEGHEKVKTMDGTIDRIQTTLTEIKTIVTQK